MTEKYTFDRASWHDIAAERRHQIMKGYGPVHDDQYEGGELLLAAVAYMAVPGDGFWPFEDGYNPSTDPIDNLVVAGALISAEIDRLKRARMAGKSAFSGLILISLDADGIARTVEGVRAIRDELAQL